MWVSFVRSLLEVSVQVIIIIIIIISPFHTQWHIAHTSKISIHVLLHIHK